MAEATTPEADAIDPIDYEIVRNRLLAVTDEMRIALQSVSGSPTVTEATDFFTGLYVPDGSFATMGHQVTHEAAPVGAFIRHLQTAKTVTVGPDDMFIGNDPYIGALHQNDVQMACPIFFAGSIIAWAGVMAHETDVGGMDFASWSPKAREVYQEGLRIPAVKLVDQGELRADVLEMIVTASRLPDALELDIRAFIATLNVARDRIVTLTDRYGSETVLGTMQRMIDTSEAHVRERLRELPDGDVHVTDYLEHDGHENRLYRVDLKLQKRGDQMVMDFSGSSPQAPGFINATRAGLMGGITGGLIPTLGFGIPWNEGLLRPVSVEAPDGLICTAQHPAPVGSATVETIWVVTNVVCRAINLLLAASEAYAHRAQAVSSGTMATFNIGGVNQFGERFGMHLLDPLAGGSGAFASRDGLNAGGPPAVPVPSIADVEINEQKAPLLYLYRRLKRDTGGPGKFRGGHSAEIAVTVHGVDQAEAIIMTHGEQVPNSVGMFGGLPGSTVRQRIGLGALLSGYPEGPLPDEPLSLADEVDNLGPKPGRRTLRSGDVFAVSWQGGGGWGDPLEREPERVLQDVLAGNVSVDAARHQYGVVVEGLAIDEQATEQMRSELRRGRLGAGPREPDEGPQAGRSLGPGLRLVLGDQLEVRTNAGATLSVGGTDWRSGASRCEVPLEMDLHPELEMTASCCPVSGAMLAVDVHETGSDPSDDLRLML